MALVDDISASSSRRSNRGMPCSKYPPLPGLHLHSNPQEMYPNSWISSRTSASDDRDGRSRRRRRHRSHPGDGSRLGATGKRHHVAAPRPRGETAVAEFFLRSYFVRGPARLPCYATYLYRAGLGSGPSRSGGCGSPRPPIRSASPAYLHSHRLFFSDRDDTDRQTCSASGRGKTRFSP